ncbi:MAG TPA: winged helix DNA-binding domain-containing protein [Acidimicrobiales bacterium]
MGDVLSVRDLNRATLARQMLLERHDLPAPAAIERLVGLQAQAPPGPYIGLWTRLAGFERDDLATPIAERAVVKATLMRSTLHLATAADYPWLRRTLHPAMAGAADDIATRRGGKGAFDVERVVEAGRHFFAEPHTYAELSAMLAELLPDVDVGSMRYTVRTHVPLVQVPTDTRWSYPGQPRFTVADAWLGQPVSTDGGDPDDDLRRLVTRYLAAFGPATVTDLQTWSGLGKLKDRVAAVAPDLVTFRDENRRQLLDLPDAPRPAGDTPAPVRFLPEYDNVLLSHQKRTRIVADEHRKKVFLPGLRVARTVLVDGFVAGTWTVEKTKRTATLVVEPFSKPDEATAGALEEEAERLVRFVEPEAAAHAVDLRA